MTALDPQMERRCRDSFGRQQAMTTIGASVHAMRAGEVELMMPFCARLTQQHGFVHVGIITSFRGFAGVSFVRGYAETVRGQICATLTLSSREPHMASTDVSLKSRPARSPSAPSR
jgi:acyl-coenzyme A thioesterase PaaI-like protein